jgi:hypothetical protein
MISSVVGVTMIGLTSPYSSVINKDQQMTQGECKLAYLTQLSQSGLQGSHRLVYLVNLGLIFVGFGFHFYCHLR